MSRRRPTWYAFVRWLVKTFYFGTHGGLTGVDEQNVPLAGPLIVAVNHQSHLDPPATACATRRQLAFLAKEELFRNRFFGSLISSLGAFPVRRGEGDSEAIRRTIALLESGEAVLVFPEGTRGDGETLNPFNRGVAMFAKRTGAPVIPVGMVGTNIVMPRGKLKGRKAPMRAKFGRPFTYAEVAEGHTDREARELFTKRLETEIQALCADLGLHLKTSSLDSDRGSSPRLESPPESS